MSTIEEIVSSLRAAVDEFNASDDGNRLAGKVTDLAAELESINAEPAIDMMAEAGLEDRKAALDAHNAAVDYWETNYARRPR